MVRNNSAGNVVNGHDMGFRVMTTSDDCAPPGAGTEIDPFCKIQDGVDASSDGDTVLVAQGTYTGDGDRDISLFGKLITLRSTDGPALTIIDVQGGPDSIHRGFFLIHGESNETVIEGFTIMNGYLIGQYANLAVMLARPGCTWFEHAVPDELFSFGAAVPLALDGRGQVVAPVGSGTGLTVDWKAIEANATNQFDVY